MFDSFRLEKLLPVEDAAAPLSQRISLPPMTSFRSLFRCFLWCLAWFFMGGRLLAVDWSGGEMTALPVAQGATLRIDGDLGDWNLSAAEPVYIAAQTAAAMHAEWAFQYDDDALYIAAKVSLPDRPYTNLNDPQDAFWSQDVIQFRFSSDPSLAYPLNRDRDSKSDRIHHVTFWKNSSTGVDFMQISNGSRLDQGKVLNPPGSHLKIATEDQKRYIVEARIPWAALNVPGGKNPFRPGESAASVAETLWIGGDKARVALGYRKNPGSFAFQQPDSWGKLIFAKDAPEKRIRPLLDDLLAEAALEAGRGKPEVGVPIVLDVPAEGLKVSVNIVGKDGAVLRELIGGEAHPKGRLKVIWDGRDAFGNPLEPGTYQWAAYFSGGLKAEYQGGVGSSGHPYYATLDNKGAWGGDHSEPIGAASDGDSLYLLWPIAEAGQPLIKTDLQGKVLWRKNPFVGGGFGPFYAVATDGKSVYLTRGNEEVFLVRLDAKTGALQTWGENNVGEIPLYKVPSPVPLAAEYTVSPAESLLWEKRPKPEGTSFQPDPVGLAVHGERIFVSSYSGNAIHVVDAATGKVVDTLACPGPRGVAAAKNGDVYVVSWQPGKPGRVVRFPQGKGSPLTVVASGLEAPYGIAIREDGMMAVSDLGGPQQVKLFAPNGRPVTQLGSPGGRPWQGAYDSQAISFLRPAGLTFDGEGALVVAESSPPKVFSRLSVPEGKLLSRWFGPPVYWNSTWPMPDNPRNIFYQLNHAIGRANLAGPDGVGVPNAYWAPDRAGFPQVGNIEAGMPQPEVLEAKNGKLYLVIDAQKHGIFLLEKDWLRPVATWTPKNARDPGNKLGKPYLDGWIDQNADGQVQDGEKFTVTKLADGSPLPALAEMTASMHMEPNGDLFFATQANSILKIPGAGFGTGGQIRWAFDQAALAIPLVVPGLKALNTSWRHGLLGVRLDSTGNIYVAFNARVPGGRGTYDFPDEAFAKRMLEGMGHTSTFNLVKFAKFDPRGNLLWMAGRKARAGAKAGEMYHFWNLAGLVNDQYIAAASEWGPIYFYTKDGFFVDALMNSPGDAAPPGPYTFGGETSGGRVVYFPKLDELWAYSSGMAYKVAGFRNGVVEKEHRAAGTVVLDKTYDLPDGDQGATSPIVIVQAKSDPMNDPSAWANVPVSELKKTGARLAAAQFSHDAQNLYARISVRDDTPLENGATEEQMAFKLGDTAGFVMGPARDSKEPGKGDARFLAVQVGGKARLIAMKSLTGREKKPFVYETPAGGKAPFDFVGEVPGGEVELQKTGDGYVALLKIPRSFLEFSLSSPLRGDVEVRLSGAGQRGLQAVSRNYLFTPNTPATTMVDDVPTEARMVPEFWGPVEVR
jgi:hypothetical protein